MSSKDNRDRARTKDSALDRRTILLGGTTLAAASALGASAPVKIAQAQQQPATTPSGQRPNILVIFGDDVGYMNLSCYGGDIMGVQTPNIDRLAREGLRLTSFYAQPSCTAGRAAFLTGQLPVRTGMTTVGTPGSPAGLQKEDITLAEILKTRGYATAQFGKNHFGDLEEHLPHRHGFDEYWGNLYHLNGNEDLEDPDRPTNPEFRKKFDPRGLVSRAGREDVYGNGLKEHDAQVGQFLDKLMQTGLDKNTIVIYATDNGAYKYMWPEGGTSPFRGDKGTTWEAGVRVPAIIRWPGAPGGRVSSEIVDMTDLLPTLAAAAGEPDVVDKLKKGATYGARAYKLHLDGYDQTALFTGKSEKSARDSVFYYDETVLTAIRYKQFKITFSAKFGDRLDSPLQSYGRPLITNLLMDPFERQTGDDNRQYSEHKTWVLTPIVGIAVQHLATFKEFPIRQLGMSADVGKTIEGVQSQILKLQQAN